MELVLVFLTTATATLLSSMSGGGTGIIIFPVLLSMGLSLPLVVAVGSLNSAFWVVPAAYNYLKGRPIDWKFIITFSLIGLAGSYLGVQLVLNIEQAFFEGILGAVILFLVAYMYFRKDLGVAERPVYSAARQRLAYPFALLLGFYENVFGAGNAIAFSMVTFYTKGFDFISALGHYYAIALPWCLFGAVLLISKGYFDLPIMVAAVLGGLVGAYTGSRYARYKGNTFIKTLFVIIGSILGLKLLLGL